MQIRRANHAFFGDNGVDEISGRDVKRGIEYFDAIRRGLSNLSGTGHIFNQSKARAVWGNKAAISHSETLQKRQGISSEHSRMNQCKSNVPEIPILRYACFTPPSRLETSLLCRHVANDRQLELLIAIGLNHADNHCDHNAQPNDHHQWAHDEKSKSMGDKAQDG